MRSFTITKLASVYDSTGNTLLCVTFFFASLRLCVRSFRISPIVTSSLHLPGLSTPISRQAAKPQKNQRKENSFASDRKSRSLAPFNDSAVDPVFVPFSIFASLRLCMRSFTLVNSLRSTTRRAIPFLSTILFCVFAALREIFRISPIVTSSLHLPGALNTNLTPSRKAAKKSRKRIRSPAIENRGHSLLFNDYRPFSFFASLRFCVRCFRIC